MSRRYTARQDLTTRTLGEMLRGLRVGRGERLRTVAAAADMDPSVLSKVELGQRIATAQQSAALAEHFGVPAAELEAVRIADEIVKMLAENPGAAELALARIEELAGEYRVSNRGIVEEKTDSMETKLL